MSRRRIAIATVALLIANFMGGLDATIVNTALPAITSDLNGIRLIGWISSVFLLGTAVTTVLWGRVGELIGNKRTFQISVLLFIVSSLAGGLAPNMLLLIVARAFMGIGAGGMVSIPFIIYADIYPNPAQRARALGWVTAFYTLSTVVGPLIGGWLVDALSWHWVFFINLPIGLISLLVLQFSYQETRSTGANGRFDTRGAVTLIAMLVVLLFASDALASSLTRATILAVIGVALMVGFYQLEKRQDHALVPVELLKNWPVQAQNVIMFLINGFFIGYSVYAPMWAQGLLGTNATFGGLTQIAGSVLLLVGTRYTAHLMESWPYKRIVLLGIISVLLSAGSMVLATQQAPYWWLLVSGGFNGLGMGLAFTPMQVSLQDGVRQDLISVSTTFGLLFRTLGQTFMAAIFGAVLSLKTASQLHAPLTAGMVNKLTDASTAKQLPAALLPQLRTILFNGFHLIMVIGFGLVLVALLINLTRQAPQKQPRG
ncbi:MFS transporter [Levilactobacillus acidifarinae]|uniref:Transport protein n=1 Tax=Levilactobacillus acidifarinae DSM 19394 = JCM 15949 TaxID=1423715 RepID=A0A0R1LS42_9LACO|nr:MFS transporter [Levilactobacillus acidifarinae]KRK96004.1 transport protein [Levilactobacillus acidifarinae DSM 19394]GEO69308.1 MFS transporter [Levilactobacillus acidifarinae]